MEPTMETGDLEYTFYSHVPVPYVVPFAIESELNWFFKDAESKTREYLPCDPEGRWTQTAYRTIRGWLSAMDDYDAGVLKVAYSDGPRPHRLLRRLGRLTTVVVRLASVEAGWPSHPEEQRQLELRTADRLAQEHCDHGPRSVRRYVKPAKCLLRAAVRAYSRERGRGPTLIYRQSDLQRVKRG
jgi:hypothetical protein